MEKRVPGYLREYICISILVHTFNTVYPILLTNPVDRIIFEYEKHNFRIFLKECCHAGTLLLLTGKCFYLTCVVRVVKRSALFIVIVHKPLIEPMTSQFLSRRRYAWLSLGILVGMHWPRVEIFWSLFGHKRQALCLTTQLAAAIYLEHNLSIISKGYVMLERDIFFPLVTIVSM